MPTTHHRVGGKCSSSEACEFTGENTLAREPCAFFGGNVAPGVAKLKSCRVSVSAIGDLVVDQKVHETARRARF